MKNVRPSLAAAMDAFTLGACRCGGSRGFACVLNTLDHADGFERRGFVEGAAHVADHRLLNLCLDPTA